jgi:hypothetical protein
MLAYMGPTQDADRMQAVSEAALKNRRPAQGPRGSAGTKEFRSDY